MVERSQIAGKIRFGDVEQAIALIVRNSDAHTGLQGAIKVKGHARFRASLLERAVMQVLKQQTGGHVTSYVNVWPAVVVKVCGRYAQTVTASRLQNARCLGDVGERTVFVTVIQNVASEREPSGPAHYWYSFPKTELAFPGPRGVVQVELYV